MSTKIVYMLARYILRFVKLRQIVESKQIMVMEDKDIWIKIEFIIIKLERRETEISPFLFKENNLCFFKSEKKYTKV